jgi:hypothetical protein
MGNKIFRVQEGAGRGLVVTNSSGLLKAGYLAEAFPIDNHYRRSNQIWEEHRGKSDYDCG